MIYDGFGCGDRPSVLENLFHMTALDRIPGKNGDQNVATIHLPLANGPPVRELADRAFLRRGTNGALRLQVE